MTIDLRMTESMWESLWRQLSRSFRQPHADETGAIGIVGVMKCGSRTVYTVAEMIWPEAGDLQTVSDQSLSFSSSYVRRAHLRMRELGLIGLVFFHTHPFADEHVSFSWYDDVEEPKLVANLNDIAPGTHVVSVVAGRRSLQGRCWVNVSFPQPMRWAIIAGDRLEFKGLDGEPELPAPPPQAVFDRGLALTGAGALSLLRQLKVVVVGASGTGSLFCEMLVRAGCGELLIIDDDVVRPENLNRILYATSDDALNLRPKVDVLKRGLDGLGLSTEIQVLKESVLFEDSCSRLSEADLIIGCVDRALPRLLMCKVAMQYLIPYIDVGTEIGGNSEGLVALIARSSLIGPGRPCLKCLRVIKERQLRFESFSRAERGRVARLGYSDDLLMTQPAVMDLNAMAAARGMMIVRHLLQPFLLSPLPSSIRENVLTYRVIPEVYATSPNPTCDVCGRYSHLGWGDCGRTLGFTRDVVEALGDRGVDAA